MISIPLGLVRGSVHADFRPPFIVGSGPWLRGGMARREAHAVNANGVPSSSPGLFRFQRNYPGSTPPHQTANPERVESLPSRVPEVTENPEIEDQSQVPKAVRKFWGRGRET